MAQHSTAQYGTGQHSVAQHGSPQQSTLQHGTAQVLVLHQHLTLPRLALRSHGLSIIIWQRVGAECRWQIQGVHTGLPMRKGKEAVEQKSWHDSYKPYCNQGVQSCITGNHLVCELQT